MLWILISVISLAIGGFLLYGTINEYVRIHYLDMRLDFQNARAASLARYLGILLGGILFMALGLGMIVYAIDSGSLDFYFGNQGGAKIVDEGY